MMRQWLPDHQLGVAAILSHVDELIELISDLLFDYQTQEGGIFGLRDGWLDQSAGLWSIALPPSHGRTPRITPWRCSPSTRTMRNTGRLR